MRFHIGCSFRPKQIIKYLFPFLLGLLAMFGIDQVNAQVRDDFTYNYTIESFEMNDSACGVNKSFQEIADYVNENIQDGQNYYIYVGFGNGVVNAMRVYIQTTNFQRNRTNAWRYFSSWSFGYLGGGYVNSQPNSNSYQASYEFSFSMNNVQSSCTVNSNQWNRLVAILQNNQAASGTSTAYWFKGYESDTGTLENDIDSMIVPSSTSSSGVMYDSNYDIIYNNSSLVSGSYNGASNLIINGITINEGDKIPTYKDLQNMGNLDFESVSPQFPYVYFSMNKSQMSTFNAKFTFKPLIDSYTYLSLIGGGQQKYYGRYNHSNYYTYEPINCTLLRSGSVDDSTGIITFTYNNFTCSSDLTNYDKIYIFESTGYEYDQDNLYNHTIIATLLKSNVDSMLSDEYLGTLYEKLELQYGWKLLFSSYDFPMKYTYFKANHPNVLFDFLNSNDTTSDITFDNKGNLIGGRSYSILFPDIMTINIDSRYNLMTILYDDIANHSSGNTILEYWFEYPEYVLVSFPTTIDNKDNYVFYDKTGNIVNNNIKTNYGLNNLESYDLNESFKIIDSFFDDIKEPMIQLHNINQSVYDIAPDFIKLLLLIIYLLFLNSILFKVIRR